MGWQNVYSAALESSLDQTLSHVRNYRYLSHSVWDGFSIIWPYISEDGPICLKWRMTAVFSRLRKIDSIQRIKIKTPFIAVGCGAHLRKVPVRNKRPILRLPPFSDDLTKTFPASRLVFLPCPFIFDSSFPNHFFRSSKESRDYRGTDREIGLVFLGVTLASSGWICLQQSLPFFAPQLWEAHLKFWKDIIKENLLGRLVRKRKNNICGQGENASEEKP